MKSPFVKTIFFALLAAVVSSVAAAFYPWPERVVESEMVGKPLFESYDTASVFKIRILKFDPEKEVLNQIALERNGEKWTIPANDKFVANNSTQIAFVAKSLNELTVLSEESSDSEAFVEKGVVDPSKFETITDRSALGTKVILEDHKGRRIAALIVGSSLKDEADQIGNHFVRVPGQPAVYQVEFDKRRLATDFTSWVNPDLFGFNLRAPAYVPGVIGIDDYRIAPDSLGSGEKPNRNYFAEFELGQGRMGITSFSKADENGELQKLQLGPKIERAFSPMAGQITRIPFLDVKKKPSSLVKAMRQSVQSVDDAVFQPLKEIGFVKTGFKDRTFDFDAVGGEVSVRHPDGVKVTLHIGDVAKAAIGDSLQVSLHVLMTAGVDESIFTMPEKPVDPQDKDYLRKLKLRDDAIKAATIRASGINQLHASWIYLVPEDVIEKIRPDVDIVDVTPIGEKADRAAAKGKESKPKPPKVDESTNAAEGDSEAKTVEAETESTEKPAGEAIEEPKEQSTEQLSEGAGNSE